MQKSENVIFLILHTLKVCQLKLNVKLYRDRLIVPSKCKLLINSNKRKSFLNMICLHRLIHRVSLINPILNQTRQLVVPSSFAGTNQINSKVRTNEEIILHFFLSKKIHSIEYTNCFLTSIHPIFFRPYEGTDRYQESHF